MHSAPDEDLPSVLESVYEWPWPRGDLHHWAPTLNRFDAILENTLTQYGITDLQYHDFTPNTKRLIVSIIRFTRLLLESCTNRKIYNSYEVNFVLFLFSYFTGPVGNANRLFLVVCTKFNSICAVCS